MPPPRKRDEFALIEALFAPLAADNPGALGLRDDAALIPRAAGRTVVATTDMLVAGVHFRPDDPADLVARKLLRVNLSDLAAMGADPRGYLLGIAVPDDGPASWLEDFARGLAEDQATYAIPLLGGDTTATPGPATLSVTALGEVEDGTALLRSGAAPGEDVYVSGTVGDAALGLIVLGGGLAGLSAADAAALADRYRLPRPRLGLGAALRGIASAAVDVSDGLVADLGHICETSGVGAVVDAESVPLSPPAAAAIADDPALLATALTGGDDYELVFTARPERAGEISSLSSTLSVPIRRIGATEPGNGVRVRDAEGSALDLPRTGWRHFAAPARD